MHDRLPSNPTETSASVEQKTDTLSPESLGGAALQGAMLSPETIAATEELHNKLVAGEKNSIALAGRVGSSLSEHQSSLANTLFRELGKSEAEIDNAKSDLAALKEKEPQSAELIEALQAVSAADASAEAIAGKMAGADSGTVRALSYSLEAAEYNLDVARARVFDIKNAGKELPPEIVELDAEYKKYMKMAYDAMYDGNVPKEDFASSRRDEAKKALVRKKASLVARA